MGRHATKMLAATAISGLHKVSGEPDTRRDHVVRRCGSGSCACGPEHDEGLLQRTSDGSTASTRAAPESVYDALRSPGTALDADTRAFFEPLFGHDFSTVRVHAGQSAADSAEAISARAYTVGNDIVLRSGVTRQALAPESRLLAHELTHVVQRSGGMPLHRQLEIGPAGSPAELEADRVADHVLSGRRVRVGPSPAGIVRRQLSCPELIRPTTSRLSGESAGQPTAQSSNTHEETSAVRFGSRRFQAPLLRRGARRTGIRGAEPIPRLTSRSNHRPSAVRPVTGPRTLDSVRAR